MAAQGTFIVIEGADTALIGRQFKLLSEQLRAEGYQVVCLAFPRLEDEPGYFARRYRQGDYGQPGQIGPYAGSLVYELDHFDAAATIRGALADEVVVLVSHYTGATMASEGVKFRDPSERQGFYVWLDNMAFEVMQLPRPSLNLVLHVPDNSQTANSDQISLYHELCQLFPKDYVAVDSARSGQPLADHDLGTILVEKVRPHLPAVKSQHEHAARLTSKHETVRQHLPYTERQSNAKPVAKSADTPSTPPNFDPATAKLFAQAMDEALVKRNKLRQALIDSGIGSSAANDVSELVLPLGTGSQDAAANTRSRNPELSETAQQYLPASHGNQQQPRLVLAGVWPRNESGIVPHILYPYSDISFRELVATCDDWPYERKAEVLQAYYRQAPDSPVALKSIVYNWEVLSSLAAQHLLIKLSRQGLSQQQPASPRYGYEVPAVIDEAGLADEYMSSFDSALDLFSRLQQEGYTNQAQLAVRAGHRVRWMLQLNGYQLRQVLTDEAPSGPSGSAAAEVAGILASMRDKLQETHPLFAASLTQA